MGWGMNEKLENGTTGIENSEKVGYEEEGKKGSSWKEVGKWRKIFYDRKVLNRICLNANLKLPEENEIEHTAESRDS